MVLPVRIIMSPTCSSRFLVGRKTRSAALRTTTEFLPKGGTRCSPASLPRLEAYGMTSAAARRRRRLARRGAGAGVRWYVRPALEARRCCAALALCGVAVLAGCGGGDRQDEDEPEGDFAVDVTRASFPEKQKLAQSSDLVINVRNAGDRKIPNVAVTVEGFNFASQQLGLADAQRPQFAVNGVPREIGGFPEAKNATPLGCDTAYVDT